MIKKHFYIYRNYYTCFLLYYMCIFSLAEVYAHWHFEQAPLDEFYQRDVDEWQKTHYELPYMTFDEWLQSEDQRTNDHFRNVCDECAYALDPWFDNSEKGRD